MEKTQVPGTGEPRSSDEVQLADLLDHRKPREVLSTVEGIYRQSFAKRGFTSISSAFALTGRLFAGRFPGYRSCNTEYHDYCHSLEVFSTSARLLDGAILIGMPISELDAADLLIAALVHDSGYIQEEGDREGTGAKHTRTHVTRSAAFIVDKAAVFGLPPERAARIGRLVLGTNLALPWDGLPFADAAERFVAAVLAAADLLGQMADRAYLEKLLFLYYEFREAGIEGYATAFDILKKTAAFYGSVKARLDGPLGEASGLARAHFAARFGTDRDLYREAIARQMAHLDSILADDRGNFRCKLKRLDIEEIERKRA